MSTRRKLYRSKSNKVIAGLFGGLGKYFDVDPVLLRLVWLVIVIFTGVIPGVIVYFVSILLVPKESGESKQKES